MTDIGTTHDYSSPQGAQAVLELDVLQEKYEKQWRPSLKAQLQQEINGTLQELAILNAREVEPD